MADYYPLIARAVVGLEQNNGENRRGLYERARTALVAQLRGTQPALEEGDITRERLALEDAIRRVEGEAARRNRLDPPSDSAPDSGEERPPVPPVAVRPSGSSLTDRGIKGFREVVAEAERLGDAASAASKSARETQASNERPRGERTPERSPETPSEPPHLPPGADIPLPHEQQPRDQFVRDVPPSDTSQGDRVQAEPSESESEFEAERALTDSAGPPPESWPEPAITHPRYSEVDDDYRPPRRSYRGIVKAAVILLLIAGVAVAGWWQRDRIGSLYASLRSSSPAPSAQQQAAPRNQKIADRVGGDQGRSSSAPAADVAQKVVLYDEDPTDAQGKRYVGSAIWRTETVSPGSGMAPELAVRADVEIPERRIRMTWSIRRNTDKALPASHTIEIMFALPADFPEGGIQNVPGVLMKQNEQARGVPLAGLAVKVTNNFFLIGLSSVPIDLERNVQLLKERSWFDVPLVYNTGKRAILAVERGTPGDRVFEEAFRAWGQ